jgi:hypothetical protein
MSWRAQNRSKDAKNPSVAGGRSRKPKLALCGIQPYMYLVLLDGIPIGLCTAMSDAINYSKDKGDIVVYEVMPNSERCVGLINYIHMFYI